jgi:hypothetical protein
MDEVLTLEDWRGEYTVAAPVCQEYEQVEWEGRQWWALKKKGSSLLGGDQHFCSTTVNCQLLGAWKLRASLQRSSMEYCIKCHIRTWSTTSTATSALVFYVTVYL